MELITEKTPQTEIMFAAWQLETGRHMPITDTERQFLVFFVFIITTVTIMTKNF